MKPISKLYLKIFLLTGFPFGITMTISDLIDGKEFNLWSFLFLFIGFGFFMSIFLVSLHVSELKSLGVNDLTDDALNVNQQKELSTDISKDELIQILKNDPLTRKMKLAESENSIILRSKPSWKSWGEKIQIRFTELENGISQIFISSKPKLFLTFLDYGRNKKNINTISKLLIKTV